jgi:membrane-associated phospholipid phosphatase
MRSSFPFTLWQLVRSERVVTRGIVIVTFLVLWWWVYDAVNGFASNPVRTFHRPSPAAVYPWIVQPWTAWIYVAGGAIFPVAPFLYYRQWRGIAFVMACITTSSVVAFGIYCAWPLSMVRPQFAQSSRSLSERLLNWVFSVDEPGNCFPSSHVFFAVLGASLIGRIENNRRLRACWWAFALAVCATTITSGQHYFIDVPGGVAVAWLGERIGRGIVPPGVPLKTPSAEMP